MDEKKRLERASKFYLQDQLSIDRKLVLRRYRATKSYFRGKSALEMGPAEGLMTEKLLSDFESVTIVEGSRALLGAIPCHPRLRKIHSLFEEFSPQDQFDTIIMDHVLEHVEDPVRLLSLAGSWLVPNGIIIAGVPNANSLHRLAAVKMGLLKSTNQLNDRDISQGHRRVYSVDEFRNDFMSAGLTVIQKLGGVFLKPLSHSQIEETWTDPMIEAFFDLGEEFPDLAADIYIVASSPA
jgi:2-polyprenyl-3-methyl-5-hydroxy-6-metoxy-1,4-benzoquinol methylase